MNIYNFTLEELENYLIDNGFKKFNATQLVEWIYEKKVYDFDKDVKTEIYSSDKFNDNLINNYELIGEAIVKTIANYIGINYTDKKFENTYIVKKGDSLYQIAKKYNTTVDAVMRENHLTEPTVKEKCKLLIPKM